MMARAPGPYAFVTVDVFTNQRFGGNPLAVFPEATGLDSAQMQALAAEFNLSETTFVLPPQDAANTAQVRIFTPKVEIGFAGHPNLGTAWVLAQQGKDKAGLLRFEEAGGLVTVSVERQAGSLVSCRVEAPQALKLSEAPDTAELAACGGLKASDLLQTDVASVGLDCVYALVPEAALAHAAPDLAAFRTLARRWLGPQGRFHLCLYARDGQRLHARVFGPLNGVTEDPACGSATCSLAAMLLHQDGGETNRLVMHMGAEMGRPSMLHCGARRAPDGIRAWVGGSCVDVLRGEALV
jgi:trans-2,3-dihydro-3-hydroxyanthranilate isomerase